MQKVEIITEFPASKRRQNALSSTEAASSTINIK
jgi:hypothetical protein